MAPVLEFPWKAKICMQDNLKMEIGMAKGLTFFKLAQKMIDITWENGRIASFMEK